MATQQSHIKKAVEKKLGDLLKKDAKEPTKADLQVLTLSLKYLAVAAKLDEADFGKDLDELTKEKDD